jgi:hypothetical protein
MCMKLTTLFVRYMRPNTLHYVVTIESSIVYGRHFYSASTVQSSILGIVHTFIMSNGITNVLHDQLHTMLRRMMAMWYENYDQDPLSQGSSDPHCPKISTPAGLMDVIAVGNLLECGQVLDRRNYTKVGIHWAEQGEMAMARWRYRMLQTIFARHYIVTVDGKPIHPISVFRRSLVEFAAAIVVYKKTRAHHFVKVDGCNAARLEEKMKSVFSANHPELVPVLTRLVDEGAESLVWTGPAIEILPRTKDCEARKGELNFSDFELYPPAPIAPVAKAPPSTATKKKTPKVPVVPTRTVVTRSAKASSSQDAPHRSPAKSALTTGPRKKSSEFICLYFHQS